MEMILRNVEILKFYAVCTNVWKQVKKSSARHLKVSVVPVSDVVPLRSTAYLYRKPLASGRFFTA